MMRILGIGTIGGMGSYLGIPENLGGAKTQIFGFISDRLQNRVNGWTMKFLSRGGKEVLIKSVLTALPTYVMSCFRLPKTLIKKLTSAIARFWWSSNGNNRGMHWMAWDKLCRHKSKGGMGFRDLERFNTAMLAKQLWRLVDTPESLFSRVLKGRYFPNTGPLDMRRVYTPSYGWKSIISARSLVKKGLIKRVGSGSTIEVWNDPWIPTPRQRPATCKFPFFPPTFKVSDLIHGESNTWNIPLLEATIIPEDVAVIRTLPISRFGHEDSLGWHYTKNGKYSVKSGYDLETATLEEEGGVISYGPDLSPLQVKIWKTKCPPKIQHFLWQVINGCVPVLRNLRNRGIGCDARCSKCGAEDETINHVLFECPPAVQTWALSNIPSNPDLFPSASVFVNMDYLLFARHKEDIEGYFPWIIWYLWKARNEKMYNNKERSPREIIILAEAEGKIWNEAQRLQGESTIMVSNPSGGVETNPRWYCQIDGSWKHGERYSGQGWVCSGIDGEEFLVGTRNTLASLSPLHVEMESLLWAMVCMRERQRLSVVFATDCLDVVKMVSSPEEWPAFAIHLEEFSKCKESFQQCNVVHIPRRSNTKADELARSARNFPSAMMYIDKTTPPWITIHP